MYVDKPTTYTDYYELTMAQGYFLQGKADQNDIQKIHQPTFSSKQTDLSSRDSYPLIQDVIHKGEQTLSDISIPDSSKYCRESLNKLSGEYKRYENPHIFKVGITPNLLELRDKLLEENKS